MDHLTTNKYDLQYLRYLFKTKVKQSRYRPGVAQRIPGS